MPVALANPLSQGPHTRWPIGIEVVGVSFRDTHALPFCTSPERLPPSLTYQSLRSLSRNFLPGRPERLLAHDKTLTIPCRGINQRFRFISNFTRNGLQCNTCYAVTLAAPIDRPNDHRHMRGWGARIRTWECRYQKPVPYHLATPQHALQQIAILCAAGKRLCLNVCIPLKTRVLALTHLDRYR